MSAEHEDLENSVAAYVLGSADSDEQERVRAHLPSCAGCRELAARLGRGVSALPLEPEPIKPPARLEERVVAAARGAPVAADQRARPKIRSRSPLVRVRFGVSTGLAAAAVLVFALGAAAGIGIDHLGPLASAVRPPAPEAQRYQLKGSGALAGVQGNAVYLRRDGLMLVDFKYLPEPGQNRVYELWLITDDGRPLPAGVFSPESDGSKVVLVDRNLKGIKALAVTMEPGPNGSTTPSQTPGLTARVS